MTKTLLNEDSEDCRKVGLNPFCKLNPLPDAKYDHEAARKARAAKKTTKKHKKKPTASEMLNLDDTSELEDDTGASQAVEEEPLNSSDSNYQEVSRSSSGESSQTQLRAFKSAPGGQAKPSKKEKVTKPAKAPKAVELEQQVSAPEVSEKQQEPAPDVPPEIPDLSTDHTNTDSLITEPSSSLKPSETHTDDVLITGTGFTEPGNPTALSKHSAKEEVIKRPKVRFDVLHCAQLSSSEILSRYLSQVHSSRDLEIDMVKQMHQKYENATAELQSQLTDAKTRLENQEAETRKADSKFQFSVAEKEKLKTSFEAERTSWAEEKTALMQQAEKAEEALQEVTTELTGLKHHVSQLVSAIFGPRSSNLNQHMLVKLKAVYTLVEQLYTGAQHTLATISLTNQALTLLIDVLKRLFVLPARIDEMKRSLIRLQRSPPLAVAQGTPSPAGAGPAPPGLLCIPPLPRAASPEAAARLVTDPSPSRAIALRPSFAAPSSPVLPVARLFVHLPARIHRPSPLPEGLPIAGPPAVAARRRSPELLRLVRRPVLDSPSTAPPSPLPSPWSSPVRNPPPILLPLLPYGHRLPLPHVARACADAHHGASRASPCSGHRGLRLSWPCSAPAADLWPRTASSATPSCSAFLASPPGAGAVAPPVPAAPCPAAGSGERPVRRAAPSARFSRLAPAPLRPWAYDIWAPRPRTKKGTKNNNND
nr:actin cytoskeleton-regulatory complex protein PAN1-like [Aegilops tauschii subsp. strangulata]